MKVLKALWLAIIDVVNMYKLSPKLLCEIFKQVTGLIMSILGILSLILIIVLFPFVVYRKYKNIKLESRPKPRRIKAGEFLA